MKGAKQSKPRVPFEGFVAHLRQSGFEVGVDRELRLLRLLELAGPVSEPGRIKTLLAPIFVTDGEQQEEFYRLFEDYFGSWFEGPPEGPPVSVRLPRERPRVRYWWMGGAAVAAVALVIAIFFWPVSQRVGPPGMKDGGIGSVFSEVLKTGSRAQPDVPATPRSSAPARKPSGGPPSWPAYLGATLAIAGVYLLLEIRNWRQRRSALTAASDKRPPYTWPLSLPGQTPTDYQSARFRATAQRLHRREAGDAVSIDVFRTVQATLAQLGFPVICYSAVTRLPEFLVLIDRRSPGDHQAELFTALAMSLAAQDLSVAVWYFSGDPRRCSSVDNRRRVSLADLLEKYESHRLILFTDAESFTDPVSGRPMKFVRTLQQWKWRAILTPRPPGEWGTAERALADRFPLLPATLGGLEALEALIGGETPEIESHGPSPVSEDVEELEAGLSAPVFRWLCACAVYPELNWALTLNVASIPELGGDLMTEANLLALFRLPWFRRGAIPEEARAELIGRLDAQALGAVRRRLIEFMDRSPAPASTFAASSRRLEIAVQRHALRSDRKTRAELRQALLEVEASGWQTSVPVLRAVKQGGRLSFLVPRKLEAVLYRNGVGVGSLRPSVRLGIVGILLAAVNLGYFRPWSRVGVGKTVMSGRADHALVANEAVARQGGGMAAAAPPPAAVAASPAVPGSGSGLATLPAPASNPLPAPASNPLPAPASNPSVMAQQVPFHLVLLRNGLPVGGVLEDGDKIKLAVQLGASVSPGEQRWVYVIDQDPTGRVALIYPPGGTGNLGNRINIPRHGADPIPLSDQIYDFAVTAPYGADSLYLIVTPSAVPIDNIELTGSVRGVVLPSVQAIGDIVRGAPGALERAPADWYVERTTILTQAKGAAPPTQIPAEGTVTFFSAARGSFAYEDESGGFFTTALVRDMKQPGAGLQDLFQLVEEDVTRVSGGKQRPYYEAVNGMAVNAFRFFPAPAQEKRFALVIGVDRYDRYPDLPLNSAVKDADHMLRVLNEAGFEVAGASDPPRAELSQTLSRFVNAIPAGSVALFYFAGRGISQDGVSYILPADSSAQDARTAGLSIPSIQQVLTNSGARLRLLFIDACGEATNLTR